MGSRMHSRLLSLGLLLALVANLRLRARGMDLRHRQRRRSRGVDLTNKVVQVIGGIAAPHEVGFSLMAVRSTSAMNRKTRWISWTAPAADLDEVGLAGIPTISR